MTSATKAKCRLVAVRDPGLGQVVGAHFDRDLVAGQDTDVVHPHFPGDVGQNNGFLLVGVQSEAINPIGKDEVNISIAPSTLTRPILPGISGTNQ